jgi:hypothetical protein
LYHPESYERDEMGIRGDQHYMFVSHVYDDTKAQLPENLFRLCQLMAPYVTPGSWLIVQEDKVCPLRGYYLYPDGVYEAANIQVHSEKGPKMAAFCDLTDIRYTLWWFEHKDETR